MGRIYVHRLWIASLFGAIWSYWFGGSIVWYFFSIILPWLWGWFAFAACHYVLIFITAHPPAAMVSFWGYVLTPNWIFGLIWLCYYMGAMIKAGHLDYFPANGKWQYQFQVFADQRKRNPPAHSAAWEGEQKHKLVEACYNAYRLALTRYDPPPITELKTPETFFHRPKNTLEWQITTNDTYLPTLPEGMLTPEGIHNLMPLLAHHLYWYQTLDTHTTYKKWASYPDKAGCWLTLTGNGLWLPVLVKTKSVSQIQAWLENEVFAADRFAYWLGQGPGLLHILRYFQAELKRRGEDDLTVPTLASRIGQLESLVTREEEKMREMGLRVQGPHTQLLPPGSLPEQLLPPPQVKQQEPSTQRPFWHNA